MAVTPVVVWLAVVWLAGFREVVSPEVSKMWLRVDRQVGWAAGSRVVPRVVGLIAPA
jgi:hypothetical protein